MKNNEEEYTPFGREWKKNIMRLNKEQIIKLYKDVCITNIKLGEQINVVTLNEMNRGGKK